MSTEVTDAQTGSSFRAVDAVFFGNTSDKRVAINRKRVRSAPIECFEKLVLARQAEVSRHSDLCERSFEFVQETKNRIVILGNLDAPEMQAVLASEIVTLNAPTTKTKGYDWKLSTRKVQQLNDRYLSKHPVAEEKDGVAFVFAQSVPGSKVDDIQFGYRNQDAIEAVSAFVGDIDGTDKAERVANRIHDLGLAGYVYTTHSHQEKKTERGDRFRFIILLEEPFLFPDAQKIARPRKGKATKRRVITDARRKAIAEYHSRYAGMCEVLGLDEIDTSAMHLHHMQYTPRRASEDAEFEHYIIAGRALRIEDMPFGDPSKYLKEVQAPSGAHLSGKKSSGQAVLSDGFEVPLWWEDGGRFLIGEVFFEMLAWDVRGYSSGGWLDIQCPNCANHTEGTGDTAAFIESEDGFGFNCFHAHCADIGTWEMFVLIDQAIKDGEIALPDGFASLSELLCDPCLFPDDVDGEELEFDPADYGVKEEIEIEFLGSPKKVQKAFDAVSQNDRAGDDHYAALYAGVAKAGNKTKAVEKLDGLMKGQFSQGNKRTSLAARGKALLKDHIAASAAEQREAEQSEADDDGVAVIDTSVGFTPMVEKVTEAIQAANEVEPLLFSYMGGLADVRFEPDGTCRIKILNVAGLKEVASRVIEFTEPKKVGDVVAAVSAAPPHDVFDNIYNQPPNEFTKPLRGVANAPFFSKSGDMVATNGFHHESGVYLNLPSNLVIEIPEHVTSEAAKSQAKFLVLEVLGDLPLGGYTSRDQMLDAVFEGEGVAAVAHVLSMVLQQFMREMIPGPTPFYVFNKPAPGTGASLAADAAANITIGEDAPSWAMPRNKEETAKTITSALKDGHGIINFDNIGDGVDSSELAMALTQSVYMARVLHTSDAVRVDVRCTWSGTANHLTMSPELIRRSVLIDMDANAAHPEDRVPEDGWRHPNLTTWVLQNRGKLVSACLTIIQHWINEGMPRDDAARMGSFEAWAGIMGGVLESAGVKGFLSNADELWSETLDASTDALGVFLAELAGYKEGHKFKAGDLLEILNAGWEATDHKPHIIPNWGYATVDGVTRYFNATQIGKQFKKIAKKPWRVEVDGQKLELRFESETDRTGTFAYTLRKEAV